MEEYLGNFIKQTMLFLNELLVGICTSNTRLSGYRGTRRSTYESFMKIHILMQQKTPYLVAIVELYGCFDQQCTLYRCQSHKFPKGNLVDQLHYQLRCYQPPKPNKCNGKLKLTKNTNQFASCCISESPEVYAIVTTIRDIDIRSNVNIKCIARRYLVVCCALTATTSYSYSHRLSWPPLLDPIIKRVKNIDHTV